MTTEAWQRLEGAAVAVSAIIIGTQVGVAWWWAFAVFLAFDLSAVGYAAGPRIGAFTYNLVHNYAGPAIAAVAAMLTGGWWIAMVAVAWAVHVGADRALGYGLKYPDHFQHTHLGWIGRSSGDALS